MGNCCDCCCQQNEEEPEEAPPTSEPAAAELETGRPKSARKYGSTLRKIFQKKSTEKTPLMEDPAEHPETKTMHSKSTFKKMKGRFSGKKNANVKSSLNEEDVTSGSANCDPDTVSAAEATSQAYKGTVERGEKLQDTEERTITLAMHAQRLSLTAKQLKDKKKSKKKKDE
ncbi:uncharacterized protein LOC102806514 [Saccoglossus kowalevskii]|uniref:Uncharacterized protein LOC102806514 n=1 Tax=Saccoglossus kowalevskii TaxID=10224 RepID=A0ABM0MYW3_SACKO|nr:PREDICTED: uncharacterized protein LOC102806514 [Saccoglossus kowalevskii]